MNIREKLLGISDLNIKQRLLHMRDAELDEYILSLNVFIEKFPEFEAKVKEAADAKDLLAVSKNLIVIKDLLANIYADTLVQDCIKHILGIVRDTPQKVEAYVTYLCSMIAMLSIDIQMVLFQEEDAQDEAAQEEVLEATKVPKAHGSAGAEMNILAVDDSPIFLNTLKLALHETAFKLTCVSSGADALRYLQNHHPCLFLLDIEMPEMDGYQLAKEIRARSLKEPIIFITGNASKEYVLKAIKTGGSGFITKPISREQVLSCIERFT